MSIGVTSLLFEGFTTNPDLDLNHRLRPLNDGFMTVLVFSTLAAHLKHIPAQKQISLARGLTTCAQRVQVSASILDIEGDTPLTLPHNATGACWLCQCWRDLHACLNPQELWQSKPIGPLQSQALSTYIAQHPGRAPTTTASTTPWRFGDHFLSSASDLGFLHEPTKIKAILRACAETVLGENMRAIHALRTGKGGNNPQLTRARDKAWRRDIDQEFHLHYWETPSGIEFASVTVHNNYDIP
jgi:hypothetical protein